MVGMIPQCILRHQSVDQHPAVRVAFQTFFQNGNGFFLIPSGTDLICFFQNFSDFFVLSVQINPQQFVSGNTKNTAQGGQKCNVGHGFSGFPQTDGGYADAQDFCQILLGHVLCTTILADDVCDMHMLFSCSDDKIKSAFVGLSIPQEIRGCKRAFLDLYLSRTQKT